ncbi:hypothetical protein ACFVW2_15275 [Streptomyces sp. NPDC058171]
MSGDRSKGDGRRTNGSGPGRRGRRAVFAGGAALVLLAALLTTGWATDRWPFDEEDRYCWGAWQENSGPSFLSDARVAEGGTRTATERGPTPDRPNGVCTLSIGSGGEEDLRSEITVTYGPAPEEAAPRWDWLLSHLGGSAVPLPDGLPGAVTGGSGLLVLPERCDAPDGRPTTVTLTAESSRSTGDGRRAASTGFGGATSTARLLVAAANAAKERAGCAGPAVRTDSPVLTLPEDPEPFAHSPLCRIPGLEVDEETAALLAGYQVGTVGPDLQSCSVGYRNGTGTHLSALMVAEPRLVTLLDGAVGNRPPAKGWRATGSFTADHRVLRTECAGRPVGFVMSGMSEERAGAFADSVAARLGCPAVAPRP